MVDQVQVIRPETLVEEFKKNGVTHVITIPDSETNYLYELMAKEPWLDMVPVSREGETIGQTRNRFPDGASAHRRHFRMSADHGLTGTARRRAALCSAGASIT